MQRILTVSYNYETQRKEVFTESGQVTFLKIRDNVQELLKLAGAFQMIKAWECVGGDTWTMIACVDRLVELGELTEINPGKYLGQYRIFIKPWSDQHG